MPELAATEVERFLAERAQTWRPSSVRVVCMGLRSYSRFHTLMGDTAPAQQLAAIPKIACRPQTTLPKALSDAQLDIFLEAFDRSIPPGRRDYAIARCLVELGLRGQEVAHLTLETIDWRNGVLTVASNKSKHVQQLPLPACTGEALAQYLHEGRPQTTGRVLFVRHVAPLNKPLNVTAIHGAMNRAFSRWELSDQFCNTHALRHTTATRLQNSGA